MGKNLHLAAFDEGTRIKLELLNLYFRQWLPVFIERNDNKIEIYDFFAGTGQDTIGNPGSPLILINALRANCSKLIANSTKVNLFFNDLAWSKIMALQSNTSSLLTKCAEENNYGFCNPEEEGNNCPFKIKFLNEDFQSIFSQMSHHMMANQEVPRFLFLDQNGIKQITPSVFKTLTSIKLVDFLFFISSSYLKRFKEQTEFQAYIKHENLDFSETRPVQCHRAVYQYYKSLITSSGYFLGQFSIKKNANVYGVIFGSNHPRGMEKFLDVAWGIDPHTGEANHDIDGDAIRYGQTELDFSETGSANRIKKLVAFEEKLKIFLISPRSNFDIYIFSLENGISIKKTNEVLRSLEKNDILIFGGEKRRRNSYYLAFKPAKSIKISVK